MRSMSKEPATLQERIERLEKQNRRWKSYMAVLASSLVALGVMGATVATQDGHFRQITTERVSIVDSTGHEFILIGSGPEGIGMRILDKAGKRVMSLGLAADEEGSGILVADRDGRPRVGLGTDKGMPSLAMVDEKGKKVIAIGGDESSGYGLEILDQNEVARVGLRIDKQGNSGLTIYNDRGQYVRGMIRQQNGAHYDSYVDESGKEIIER
jgi:hypothetical protein